jgi:uncharacterized protein YqeY
MALRLDRPLLHRSSHVHSRRCIGSDEVAKQRRDSIESYTSAGRADLAAVEQAELEVIGTFLPALADEAQTRAWVAEAIESTGASSGREMGRVMGAVMKAHKGQVDGNLTRKIVGELLA